MVFSLLLKPEYAQNIIVGVKTSSQSLFVYLTEHAKGMLGTKAIKWNFTKFIVNRNGEIVGRYSPNTNPKELEDTIVKLLEQ